MDTTTWKLNGRRVGYIRGSTYYIHRFVAGRRVRISTGCVTENAAIAEYERFELNPSAYANRAGHRALPRVTDPVRREQVRMNHLARRYKITVDEYEQRLVEQGGKCAICGALPTGGKRGSLEVDHCHGTGAIRGLICGPCNRGIGNLGESADLLRRAAAYLDAFCPESAPLPSEPHPGNGLARRQARVNTSRDAPSP